MNKRPLKDTDFVVPYYRVSTTRQGESGLGLDAQRAAVRQYIKFKKLKILKEFTEIESGKKNNRAVLHEALKCCKENNALLLIAKLNRLGRNVAFIAALMESKVRFVSVDLPEANHFVIHIMAAVAQYQREEISRTTKDALQAAKARGVKLGQHGVSLAEINKQKSQQFAKNMLPVIIKLKKKGYTTIEALTKELNSRNISPYRTGARWHKSTVFKLLEKIKIQSISK